ncbi:UNVERIFIED_CONTAM: hypothetical protein GTU68_065774 [Idotea baltica]|nr:hypothetical protein [Idotea baltica]
MTRLLLRPASWYDDQGVTVHCSTPVGKIDRAHQTVSLENGDTLKYQYLLIATGSTPRPLPASIGGHLTSVYTLRNLADIDSMKSEFIEGKRLLVIGGGYIGLEVAAVASGLGLNVTIIELADRILNRVAAPATSNFFRALHQKHGVEILEKTALSQLNGTNGQVKSATLSDGRNISADFVIIGIGVTPNTELAEAADLETDNGIRVNEYSQSSDKKIYAAGDCASFDYQDQILRLESVQNAIDQAENAALNILGHTTEYHPLPWFWSDQFTTKLQIAGLNTGYTDTVTRLGKREGSLSIWYYSGEQLLAVDALNDPIAYTMGRKLLASGHNIPKSAVADTSVELKSFL